MLVRLSPLVVVPILALGCGLRAQEKPPAPPPSLERAAESFVALLAKGDFAKATSSFDEAMLKALPAEKLKQTWEAIPQQVGAFQKQSGTRREKAGGYEVVFVTCEFARTKLEAKLVFDKDAKISGLFFVPASKPKPTGEEEIWEGVLHAGTTELRLIFHLFKQKDGTYAATMDSPDQGSAGNVLDEVSVRNDVVRLELKSAKMTFEGKRAKDGTIMGELKQAGQTFPLTLRKSAKAK
jgi:hypothetical protein